MNSTSTDQKADDIAYYLNRMFGEDSALPKSPADLPAYKDTVHSFSDEAMKIVFVEYETPGPNRMPWSAYPDQEGKFWIPYYGRGNEVVRLNSKTGELTRFPLPFAKTPGIHSAVPAPDGSVWFTDPPYGGQLYEGEPDVAGGATNAAGKSAAAKSAFVAMVRYWSVSLSIPSPV